ncbi:23884_t:CDS:2, partial [Racocetra persica]
EEDLRDRRNINKIPPELNTHYCLINSENRWNRIMRNWNKHHNTTATVEIILMLGKEKSFRKKAMENVLFYFVKDLEADSNPVENNIINKKIVNLQKQKPNSYGYALIQTDGKLAKKIVRRTPNSIAES